MLFSLISLLLTAFIIAVLVMAHKKSNQDYAFVKSACLVYRILGYSFFFQVVFMISLVIWLLVETERAVKREMRLYRKVMHTLKDEKRTYACITAVFALSYFGRSYINGYEYCRAENLHKYRFYMIQVVV